MVNQKRIRNLPPLAERPPLFHRPGVSCMPYPTHQRATTVLLRSSWSYGRTRKAVGEWCSHSVVASASPWPSVRGFSLCIWRLVRFLVGATPVPARRSAFRHAGVRAWESTKVACPLFQPRRWCSQFRDRLFIIQPHLFCHQEIDREILRSSDAA